MNENTDCVKVGGASIQQSVVSSNQEFSQGDVVKISTKYRVQSPPLTTGNILSHSESPTNNLKSRESNANQNQRETRKRSYNIRRSCNNKTREEGSAGGGTGSLLQPKIIKRVGITHRGHQIECHLSNNVTKLSNAAADKLRSMKNQQYQRSWLRCQQLESQGGLLLPSKNSEMASAEQRWQVASPAVDDLERSHSHFQTMHLSWQQEPNWLADQNEMEACLKKMDHKQHLSPADEGYAKGIINFADVIAQPKPKTNRNYIGAKYSTKYRQLQLGGGRNNNELLERGNIDQQDDDAKRAHRQSPAGAKQYHSRSVRGASRGAQKKLFSSANSSIERGSGQRTKQLKPSKMRLQRQSSSISEDQSKKSLTQAQDASKQASKQPVIPSTPKLVLNPKHIIYAGDAVQPAQSPINQENDKEEIDFYHSHKIPPLSNSKIQTKRELDGHQAADKDFEHDDNDEEVGYEVREAPFDELDEQAPRVRGWTNPLTTSQMRSQAPAQDAGDQPQSSTVQKVRFRMSKLNQSKKFSTPVDQISPQESEPPSSFDISPSKKKLAETIGVHHDGALPSPLSQARLMTSQALAVKSQYLVTEPEARKSESFDRREESKEAGLTSDQERLMSKASPLYGGSMPLRQATVNASSSQGTSKLNFNSPSSIKIIDLKQPNVRKLLMDSLQELVKERKDRLGQREKWQFNERYDAIIKNTIQNRKVNIEKSIPPPETDAPDVDQYYGLVAGQNSMGDIIAGSATLESGSGSFGGHYQMNTQFLEEASVNMPIFNNEPTPEQSIISRSELSVQLKLQAEKAALSQNSGNNVTKKQSLSRIELNFQNGANMNVAAGDKQDLISPRQQQRLISKLNEIYEAQLLNDAHEVSPSWPRSPYDDSLNNNDDEKALDGLGAINRLYYDHVSRSPESRPSELVQDGSEEVQQLMSEQHSPFLGNIISVINNDKLYYIANDVTTSQSQMSKFLQIQQQVTQNSANNNEELQQNAGIELDHLPAQQQTIRSSLQSTSNAALENLNKEDALEQYVRQTFSRNNNKFQQPQIMVQQVSTDQKTNFIQQADLISLKNYQKFIKKEPNEIRERFVTKVPSVSDLTFFDLSNPMHLNQLFSRLEDIQKQEIAGQDKREMPKALQNQSKIDKQINDQDGKDAQMQQSGYNSPQIQQEQSGEESGNVSSQQTHTPIHSRQGVEQAHSIDVDLLIQKLLEVPNVDVLDSIFSVDSNVTQRLNINLQPSNGTRNSGETLTNAAASGQPEQSSQISTRQMIQRVTGNIQDILNFKPQAGESSLSSGGHASEIQSSGMMTPKSQKSLSTPNQIKLLQERNFNIQGFRFPMSSFNARGAPDCPGSSNARDDNGNILAPSDSSGAQQSGGIVAGLAASLQQHQWQDSGKQPSQDGSEKESQCHDLMSPMTKKLLMQKLKEVQEQIGDSQSNDSLSDSDPVNPSSSGAQVSRNMVDGVVAGSIPDPQIFGHESDNRIKKQAKSFYDPKTGALIQRALDNTRERRTKLIISHIDEEDEGLQFEEDEEMIQQQRERRNVNDKIKLNTQFEPSPRNANQDGQGSEQQFGAHNIEYAPSSGSQVGSGSQATAPENSVGQPHLQALNSNANNMQIDLLIQKLKQLELQQRLRASEQHLNQMGASNQQEIQMQSHSLGVANNQANVNGQDVASQNGASLIGPDSKSYEPIRDRSHQSSNGHSSCSSPLKVGNINIYNMPKSLGDQPNSAHPWIWKYQTSDCRHKVSHQGSIGKLLQGSSPELLPSIMQLGAENQHIDAGEPNQGKGQLQMPPSSGTSHQGGGLGLPLQQATSEHQLQQYGTHGPSSTTMMSRNHSVANILEQVIKRLEGLKSRE